MKVVQINTFENKATGTIMLGIHKLLLEHGEDSYVVWGRGREAQNDHEYSMCDGLGIKMHGLYTRITDRTGFASKKSTEKLIERLEQIKPDIIHLHNIHGYYINIEKLFDYIRIKKIKVVWTLHDCWAFTGHCAWFDMIECEKWKTGCFECEQRNTYPASFLLDSSNENWKRKRDLFTGLDVQIVTPSKWLMDLVDHSFLSEYPKSVIYNGIDTSVFKPVDNVTKDQVKTRLGLDNRPIVLGVASEWTKRKGLSDFVSLSQLMPEIQFVVVGLNDAQLYGIPATIKKLKRIRDTKELSDLYSSADLFFNPTYEDNFPTTNIEALACGTPVITYDTGGSPESIQLGQMCSTESVGMVIRKTNSHMVDIKMVMRKIRQMLAQIRGNDGVIDAYDLSVRKSVKTEIECRKASMIFDRDNRLTEYLALYHSA